MKAIIRNSLTVGGLLALLLCGMASNTLAHTELSESSPAAGAQLDAAPEQLILNFAGKVNLVRLSLSDAAGRAIALDFKPSTQAAQQFSVPLPALAAGTYTARWTALGADGHMLQGSIPFTVSS